MIFVVFYLTSAGCATENNFNRTRLSHRFHRKEFPKNQANINSLTYSTKRKTKPKKGSLLKRIFPGKKGYYAAQ